MKFLNAYLDYENKVINDLISKIKKVFESEGKAPYYDTESNKKEDEFLELISFGPPIKFKRRNNVPWEVSRDDLESAIKLTLRKGSIQRPTDYLHMYGKSNFVGTPLHLIISLLPNDEYANLSLIGMKLVHKKFGESIIDEIEFEKDIIKLTTNSEGIKSISMKYLEIDDDQFKGLIHG
ncbi:MAG: hypothetical protein M5R37_09745 [Melioribacteraceae bacterium]|nr:hypothetical protein [Melioribacteraceae bacterium]